MPGANPRALEKAKTLPADMVILDLEDAVAPDAKADARSAVVAAVQARGYGRREVLMRINDLASEWGPADITAAIAAAPDGIVLPKVETADQVRAADQLVAEQNADISLWAMIETPLSILNVQSIAATAADTRLEGFIVGTNDLAKELGAVSDDARTPFQMHLALVLTAARAYGLVAIDGVYNDFRNIQGLEDECIQGRRLGFDGKSLIHPAQLETANRVFAPEASAVEEARAIVQAFALPENSDKGVISLDGKMVELLHLEQAQRLIAVAEAIADVSSQ
jgi:citrate lyase subunit beta / citryl-CoA lyase